MTLVRALALMSLLLLPACGDEPVPANEEPLEADTPCCSLDDVMEMHKAGVDDDLIIVSLKNSATPIEPSARDLINLSEAGVSKRVVQVMMGEDPEAAVAVDDGGPLHGRATKRTPPPLPLIVSYVQGAKRFTVTNTGSSTLTGIVMTANDQYVYALPIPLPPGNPDTVKVGSFTSRATGHKLYPAEGLKKLHIKARQGSWSQRF
jgi:hypothetical protein